MRQWFVKVFLQDVCIKTYKWPFDMKRDGLHLYIWRAVLLILQLRTYIETEIILNRRSVSVEIADGRNTDIIHSSNSVKVWNRGLDMGSSYKHIP